MPEGEKLDWGPVGSVSASRKHEGLSKLQGKCNKAQDPGQGPGLPGSESGTGESTVPHTTSQGLETQERPNSQITQSWHAKEVRASIRADRRGNDGEGRSLCGFCCDQQQKNGAITGGGRSVFYE